MNALILAYLFGKDWTSLNAFLIANFAQGVQSHLNLNQSDTVAVAASLQSLVNTKDIAVQGNQQSLLGGVDGRGWVDHKTKYYNLTNLNIVAKRLK